MKPRLFTIAVAVLTSGALVAAQGPAPLSAGVAPAAVRAVLGDSWLTCSGDYSGRRYSSLTQINRTTVKQMGLEWVGFWNRLHAIW